MREITRSEMEVVLTIVKSPEVEYNANTIARAINITPMGALKILKKLEKEYILISKKIGRAVIYRINSENSYACRYVALLLSRESLHAQPIIKRWVWELKKIKNADIVVLYGSVLEKRSPNDIDVLLVTDRKRFPKLEREIKELNKISIKKIHPLYQTFDDINNNIKKRHKPLLNAIKGLVVLGEEKFIRVYDESRKE
jgi:DNA-binding MarR family transcriptional regulator